MPRLATDAIFILQFSSNCGSSPTSLRHGLTRVLNRSADIAVQGQSSTSDLYIPGFDPQPISADMIGVGSDGRTTWALHKGNPHPTDTASYADFPGTGAYIHFDASFSPWNDTYIDLVYSYAN